MIDYFSDCEDGPVACTEKRACKGQLQFRDMGAKAATDTGDLALTEGTRTKQS